MKNTNKPLLKFKAIVITVLSIVNWYYFNTKFIWFEFEFDVNQNWLDQKDVEPNNIRFIQIIFE